jgi:hypothetical protein
MDTPQTNWELVEIDYRLGQMPISAILAKHGISRNQLDRRVAEYQWSRDLVSQVQAATNEQLARVDAAESRKNDMIEAAGETAANIILKHRGDIKQLRAITVRTMDALARKLDGVPESGDALVLNDRQGVIDGVHKLADTFVRLIALERQAFNIVDPESGALNPDAIRAQVEVARRELIRRGFSIADIEPGTAGTSKDQPPTRNDKGRPAPN